MQEGEIFNTKTIICNFLSTKEGDKVQLFIKTNQLYISREDLSLELKIHYYYHKRLNKSLLVNTHRLSTNEKFPKYILEIKETLPCI